jgi:hypothetical protein
MFERRWIAAAAITMVACGSRAPIQPVSIPSVVSGRTPVEVRDSSVDALPDARIPTSPDIVFGIVEVRAADVLFRFRYRPGTFDPATTRLSIDLDTDQNAATGTSGVEYYVFVFPAGGRGADVARTTSASYTVVGTVPVTFVTDGCDIAVPLALLGDDDGTFDFRVRVYSQPALPSVIDVLPDTGFARVQ